LGLAILVTYRYGFDGIHGAQAEKQLVGLIRTEAFTGIELLGELPIVYCFKLDDGPNGERFVCQPDFLPIALPSGI